MSDTIDERDASAGASTVAREDELARQEAIKRIEHKRRYWIGTAVSAGGMLILAAIWAITEYHNAGGWPTQGFSQSSGIHDVWNIWIIYPAMAWVFLTVVGGLIAYLRKPISESQIRREIERQSRLARPARLTGRELVVQRLRVRHLEPRYRVVADRTQVLDQRAQRVAVRHDQHAAVPA